MSKNHVLRIGIQLLYYLTITSLFIKIFVFTNYTKLFSYKNHLLYAISTTHNSIVVPFCFKNIHVFLNFFLNLQN